ncbi:hypothetical protein [Luteipulveratus mongoliensis]|uniref:Lipoprotein n=1 Tax=Luteipulveratus mongoliensis TaxID=571913 RepID=A0A0K1JHF3_9MICO|nr:hypothetical protein [Luteipulveratus mongoliensis]AKU16131.1 hypothetical protein VV02_10095 [Luteipulveratus mongoliensis]
MNRTTTKRTAACSLLLAAPLTLAACGFGGDDKGSSGNKTLPGDDPSATAPGTPGPADSSTPGTEGDDDGSEAGSKPSRDSVTKGIQTSYDKTPAAKVLDTHKHATCMTNKLYDTVSPATLQILADGKATSVPDGKDVKAVSEAATICAPQSRKDGLPGMPTDLPTSLPSLPHIPGMPT